MKPASTCSTASGSSSVTASRVCSSSASWWPVMACLPASVGPPASPSSSSRDPTSSPVLRFCPHLGGEPCSVPEMAKCTILCVHLPYSFLSDIRAWVCDISTLPETCTSELAVSHTLLADIPRFSPSVLACTFLLMLVYFVSTNGDFYTLFLFYFHSLQLFQFQFHVSLHLFLCLNLLWYWFFFT